MKHLLLLMMMFLFLGADSLPEATEQNYTTEKRPTIEQQVQLQRSKLEVLNSKLSVEIAELKNQN